MRGRSYKSRGVVIPDGFGISVRLQDGVGLDDTVFQVCLLLLLDGSLLVVGTKNGKVGDDLFGVFGLAGTGLAAGWRRSVITHKSHLHTQILQYSRN
jgi:hypothetical protein